ncbi:MAG: alpha/beta fold hydrolase [bacterium]|nr:alpha/beta fold hydrolase [bacterium]
MQKVFIKNRKGQKVAVIVEEVSPQKGLAFVMHGLGGTKDQSHVQTFADAFLSGGYTAVRFDTTNTFGESDGNYEDATVTNYYEDLEDVIAWAKTQPWYAEPFCLAGHSLGGICTALYAEKYPEKVKALAPISTVVSGQLSMETSPKTKILEEWKRTGWRIEGSKTTPGRIKRLKWSHMEDRLRYDVLPLVAKLTMPVLLIVGDHDESTPMSHQKILFDALPSGKKELHIIKDAPHTFRDPKHLTEIKEIFSKWIDTL